MRRVEEERYRAEHEDDVQLAQVLLEEATAAQDRARARIDQMESATANVIFAKRRLATHPASDALSVTALGDAVAELVRLAELLTQDEYAAMAARERWEGVLNTTR